MSRGLQTKAAEYLNSTGDYDTVGQYPVVITNTPNEVLSLNLTGDSVFIEKAKKLYSNLLLRKLELQTLQVDRAIERELKLAKEEDE